jgi:Tfp pilus assembly PilM family ATPase
MQSPSMLSFSRMRPPIRRVLALDAGTRRIKFLLAQSDFGRLRVLKTESIDLQQEGLVSADEIKAHLRATLDSWGRPALAVALPQDVSISQLIDLPLAPESEVQKLIEDETIKLSGVSESKIVYDFVRTASPVPDRQQFWVTLCQENNIQERIKRLGLEQEDICEVTTTANALIAAYRAAAPLSSRAVLVHMGAQSTVVVILVEGQGVFATSFQMGGDFFTRAIARLRNCSEETADALKRGGDLLNGPGANADFAAVVDGWVSELKRQLNDWFEQHRSLAAGKQEFDVVASGGGFEQPGLLEYLNAKTGLNLRPWPAPAQPDAAAPKHFEVAFGTALQALGHSAQPVSLLPNEYRAAWKRRLNRQRLDFASLALVAVCTLLMAVATWHKLSVIDSKEALLGKVQSALDSVQANTTLTTELLERYENFRPLFARQQTTLDTLQTLALLQTSRSNRSFWYVLVADQQSYFQHPSGLSSTNRASRTNLFAALEHSAMLFPNLFTLPQPLTDASMAKPGLIAELCVPEGAEAARRVLRELVNELQQGQLFAKVDLLSDDLRRNLADPKVVLPERHFVLALDFADTDFHYSTRRPGAGAPSRATVKRSPRPGWENGDKTGTSKPN